MRLRALVAMVAMAGAACAGGAASPPQAPASRPGETPPGISRVDGMLVRASSHGFGIARVTLPLDAIPLVELPPLLDPRGAEGRALVEDDPLAELGFFEVRAASAASPSRYREPRLLRGSCGDGHRLHAIRGEGPVRHSARDGRLDYEIVDGVYDAELCKTRAPLRRTRVRAKELVANLVYAFRFVDPREPGIELLSLVLPPADLTESRSRAVEARDDVRGDFSRVTLPVRPGGSESMLARIARDDASAWTQMLAPGEAPPLGDLLVGVELSHAGDQKPQLFAYVYRITRPEDPQSQ